MKSAISSGRSPGASAIIPSRNLARPWASSFDQIERSEEERSSSGNRSRTGTSPKA